MVEQGRPLESTIEKYPGEFLTAIRAREVRKFSHPIVKDTDPPNDPAHGLVLGKKRTVLRTRWFGVTRGSSHGSESET